MIQQDTIKLLRECDAGIKMGVASIDDVLGKVQNEEFEQCLTQCKKEHEKLETEIKQLLDKYQDEGKNPNPIAKGMSWIKTNVKLGINDSDGTVANLMTDGCDMGVKSLNRYLNEYEAADEKSKDIAKRLIKLEEKLRTQMQEFL
jgi:predicted ribosome quality control (RQC) complex YloA/Tae2 family protein